ncbi:MAG: hypothetical protein OES32_14270 [Acidobacteriota bacterium]|nr:hypothetical protein [Acidobacteriota bacterium]MDH3524747.1 hypothetical protein [Acidobacteriota bacterium]
MTERLELDVLRAAYGDCLIVRYQNGEVPRHILFDGGPTRCWDDALEPHLESLWAEFKDEDDQLVFELGICSHIDRDHIRGLLELTLRLLDEADGGRPFVRFNEFWHNNLRNIVQRDDPAAHSAALASIVDENTAALGLENEISRAVLASYSEGNKLRQSLSRLAVTTPFVSVEDEPRERAGGLIVRVLAPSRKRIEALQKAWEVRAPDAEQLAADLDSSIPNLASIVTLLEFGAGAEKKTLLMTGDALWTDVIEGLEAHGYPVDGSAMLDVLKLPHHGSGRNVGAEFFERVPARIYVISANGRHSNPDAKTIDMLREGRARSRPADEPFTLVMADTLTSGKKARRKEVLARLEALEAGGCTILRPDGVARTLKLV